MHALSHQNLPRHRSGFTVLELLVVLFIIFVVLGLILPTTSALRNAGRRRRAAMEAQSIIRAIKTYRNVYGHWPLQTTDTADYTWTNSTPVISALTTNILLNPRQTHLIEIPDDAFNNGAFLDPWNRSYIIALDYNEDGHLHIDLTVAFQTPGTTNIRNETVAVMSAGPDPHDASGRIYSWTR